MWGKPFLPLPQGVDPAFHSQYQTNLLARLGQAAAAYGAAPRGQQWAQAANAVAQNVAPLAGQYQALSREREVQNRQLSQRDRQIQLQEENYRLQRAQFQKKIIEAQQAQQQREAFARSALAGEFGPIVQQAVQNGNIDGAMAAVNEEMKQRMVNQIPAKSNPLSDQEELFLRTQSEDPEVRRVAQEEIAFRDRRDIAKANKIDIRTGQPDTFARKSLEAFASDNASAMKIFREQRQTAVRMSGLVDRMGKALERSGWMEGRLRTGAFGQLGKTMSQIGIGLAQLVGDESSAQQMRELKFANLEDFISASKQFQLVAQSALKGDVTNRELQVVLDSIPSLARTPEGNRLIIKQLKRALGRVKDRVDFLSDMKTRPENRGYLPPGWESELADYDDRTAVEISEEFQREYDAAIGKITSQELPELGERKPVASSIDPSSVAKLGASASKEDLRMLIPDRKAAEAMREYVRRNAKNKDAKPLPKAVMDRVLELLQ